MARLTPVEGDPFAVQLTPLPEGIDPFNMSGADRAQVFLETEQGAAATDRMRRARQGARDDPQPTQLGEEQGYGMANRRREEAARRDRAATIDDAPPAVSETLAYLGTVRTRLSPEEYPWLFRRGQMLTPGEINDIVSRSATRIDGMTPDEATRELFGRPQDRRPRDPGGAALGVPDRPPSFQADPGTADLENPVTGVLPQREREGWEDTIRRPMTDQQRLERWSARETREQRETRHGGDPSFAGGMSQTLLGVIQRTGGGIIGATGTILEVLGGDPGDGIGAEGTNYLQNLGRYVGERGRQRQAAANPEYEPWSAKWAAFQIVESSAEMGGAILITAGTRNPAAGAALLMGARVGAEQYDESVRNGRDPRLALVDGVVYGLAEMIPERIALGRIMRPGQRFAGRVFTGFATEAAQETLTESIQILYDSGVLHEEMTWGEVRQRLTQAGFIGGLTGGTIAGGIHGFERAAERFTGARDITGAEILAPITPDEPGAAPEQPNPRMRPGFIEEATGPREASISGEDDASPLPNDLIEQGRRTIDTAAAQSMADQILVSNGAPTVGSRVRIRVGGREMTGTVADAFVDDTDAEAGPQAGLRVDLDGGGQLREFFGDIADAGGSIEQVTQAPAAARQRRSRTAPAPAPAPARDTGHRIAPDIYAALTAEGFPDHVAQGVAAGIAAEANSDHTAVNPRSGALGLGQWLGPRLAEVRRRYGPNPTREQQIQFLVWELRGGDHGGASVLNARNAEEALNNYITRFMRPAAGVETEGDLARGRSALGSGPATGAAPMPGSRSSEILTAEINGQVPVIDTEVTQAESTAPPAAPATTAVADQAAPAPELRPTASGRGITLVAEPTLTATIRAALPDSIRATQNRDGHLVFSKKHETAVLAAVEAASTPAITPSKTPARVSPTDQPARAPAPNRAPPPPSARGAVQPDLLGGRDQSEAEMDARRQAPAAVMRAVDEDRLPRLIEAAAYTLNRNNGEGDREGSRRDLGAELGMQLENDDAARDFARAVLDEVNGANEDRLIDKRVFDRELRDAPDGDILDRMREIEANPGLASRMADAEMDQNAARLWEQGKEVMEMSPAVEKQAMERARVIAGLAGTEKIGRVHIAESLSYVATPEERGLGTLAEREAAAVKRAKQGARVTSPSVDASRIDEMKREAQASQRSGRSGRVDENLGDAEIGDLTRNGEYRVVDLDLTEAEAQEARRQDPLLQIWGDSRTSTSKGRRFAVVEPASQDSQVNPKAKARDRQFPERPKKGSPGEVAREIAHELVARGFETSGFAEGYQFGIGQKVSPSQPGPQMTPGKIHIEVDGKVHTFAISSLKENGASANAIFTEDAAERARAVLREKFKGNTLTSGFDPELAQAGLTLAGYHIEKGARTFVAYAKAMLADLGEAARPHLRGWYEAVRHYPGMEAFARDMSNAEEIGAAMVTLSENRSTEGEETGDGVQGTLPAGDARASAEDVQLPSEERGTGRLRAEEERGGAPPVRAAGERRTDAAERPGEEPGQAQGDRGASARDDAGLPGRDADSGRGRRTDPAAAVTGENWLIEPGSLSESRGAAVKARDNVKAIEIVKALDESGMPATREQQADLARYVGWGGLKSAFDPDSNGYMPKLKDLLTEQEYETARRSIQYAHYTSEKVVRPMWEAAARMGFKGGKVFEPGLGTGNFIGMMPAELAGITQYSGVEFDGITARIAQLLYPKSGISHADFTENALPKDAYDLVIGNPPFSQTVVRSDPEYGKLGFVLHDFFFAKSLDAVRPGGLLMFVTSAGTMNKLGTEARAWMAERADLVGAIRLPGGAFKENAGTEVTTDIVILKKRLPGAAPGDASWVETANIELPKKDGTTKEGAVSRYFVDHPEQVLGEQGFFDKLSETGERYGVRPIPGADLTADLRAAFDRIAAAGQFEAWEGPASDFDLSTTERKEGSFYIGKDGRLMQHRAGYGIPVEGRGKGTKGGIAAADQERIRALVPVRDALRTVLAHDMAGDKKAGDAARAALNSAYDRFHQRHGPINKAEIRYQRPSIVQQESARAAAREEIRLAGGFFSEGSFDTDRLRQKGATMLQIAAARKAAREAAAALGRDWDEGSFDPAEMPDIVIVRRPNIDPFMDDQEGYRLRSIEHYNDESGEAKKGNVFFENVITKERAPEIRSAQDALLFTLNRLGRPDLDEIASRAKMSGSQVMEELADVIFKVPNEGETYQTREIYLSGKVRAKLDIAREAAARDPAFKRNVEALELVQPAALGPSDIAASLGMPWIPPDVVEAFMAELGIKSGKVKYRQRLAQWSASGDKTSAAAKSEWGTSRRDAVTLLNDVLNRQDSKVFDTIMEEGRERQVLNPVETQGAQDKARAIKARFAEWIWSDTGRADRLTTLYNSEYNNLVAPVYDGSYLTTPGISTSWSWRPHQQRVVARIIQAGNTYMAHAVGAGKTSAMIGAGMEMRRLGLVRKPMYAVPNHMLGQFTKEFYEQYPTARIMVADERQFHTDRRKQFVANMAAEDLDAVIITHSAFGLIGISDDFSDGLLSEQIADYRGILQELKTEQREGGGDGGARITQRRIEQQIESMEQKLKGRRKRSDQVFTFEQTGVDFLFVDEAHLFRKLDFATRMGSVRGVDPNGSQMAYDLFAKTRYLETQSPGRSHVLASGTAVTNTMAELFTVQRYQQLADLEAHGLAQFDAWAGAFGETVTALEQDPAGGYKPQTRFAKFVNVPELSAMVRQFMDVVTSRELDQYVVRPKLKGGSRQMILAQPTPALEAYQGELQRRMKAIESRGGRPQKGDDILLSVIGDGRKAAIDMRLVSADYARDEASKLEMMIANVARIAEDTKRAAFFKVDGDAYAAKPAFHGPATQMVFSDLGINGDFQIHRYIKGELLKRGLRDSEVAVISDFKTHVARQRLFNDMNEGKVRVLIGSVPKMGTGVNAQRRLYASHNLDPQWYPANDEQRNGRSLRQGNMNPEIEIFDYSTKGTYDSTMWGLMETKARFIEGFFAGDPTMRSMEDLGEASQYEQAKAITTADPRILELTGYKQDLQRAELRRAAFDREQYNVRDRIRMAQESSERARRMIPLIEQDIAARKDISGDNFSAAVGNTTYTERAEFGDAVLDRMRDLVESGMSVRDRKIGEVGGFDLTVDVSVYGTNKSASLYLNRSGAQQERVSAETPAGIATSAAAIMRGFEREIEDLNARIERNDRTVEEFTPQTEKVFTGHAEIDDLSAKVEAIERTLTAENLERQAATSKNIQYEQPEAGEPTGVAEARAGVPVGGAVSRESWPWSEIAPYPEALTPAILKRGRTMLSEETEDARRARFGREDEEQRVAWEARDEAALARIRAQGGRILTDAEKLASRPPEPEARREMRQPESAADLKRRAQMFRQDEDQRRAWDSDERRGLARLKERGGRMIPRDEKQSIRQMDPEDIAAATGDLGATMKPDWAALESALRKELISHGLGDRASLDTGFNLFRDPRQGGSQLGRLIKITLEKSEPVFALRHEIIHRLKELGLFNRTEWTSLEKYVRARGALMESVAGRYPDMSEADQVEEAIADAYAEWREGREEPRGFVARALKRLDGFIRSLWRAARGTPAYEQIFEDVAAGRVGERESDDSTDGSSDGSTVERRSIIAANAEPDAVTVSDIMVRTRSLVDRLTSGYEKWRTAAQDRMLPVMRLEAAAERALGRELTDEERPYLAEELMSGRVGAQLDQLATKLVEPLIGQMKADKVTQEDLESYLYARHAPERNAHIASINPEFDDESGSGMSDIEAEAIMRRIETSGRMKEIERAAAMVDEILAFALDTRVEGGLMSEERADAWRNAYEHYVPLRGFAELDGAPETPDIGSGISVRGPESKRAFGRRSKADDILAYSIMQAEEAIIRAGKNKVAQALFDLAVAAPDPDFWTTKKVVMRRRINPHSGLVESYPVTAVTGEDADWTVSLKIDGKERRVKMNRRNPAARQVAEAMRRLNEQQAQAMIVFLSKVNRWLSAANTSLNPEFVITNAFRDLQTATINLAGFDKKGLQTAVVRDWRKALFAATRGAFGKEEGDWGKWWREFTDEGGRVYFNRMQDLDTLRRDMERRLNPAKSLAAASKPKQLAMVTWGTVKTVYGFIDKVNLGVENAVRLSAYKNAREMGMSKSQAASLAKNLTVNFNRRGSWGVVMNALYLFYNASIQGSFRLLIAMKHKKVRRIVAGIVVAGALQELLNMMLSPVDDDDQLIYDKIPEFEKSRNIIIMASGPWGDYIKIPMPWGYNAFHALGRSIVRLGRGQSPTTVMGNLATTFIDAFNPVGGTNSLLNLVSPTVADPLVDLTTNRDFADRPIMPDQPQFGPQIPDNQRYWGNVSPVWKYVTDTLNSASGGDQVVPGKIDVSPETLEYLFGVATGGAGAFVDRSAGAVSKLTDGDPTTVLGVNDVPMLRRLVGSKPVWYDRAAFYTRLEQVDQFISYARTYAERGDREALRNLARDNGDLVRMERAARMARREMRAVREARNDLAQRGERMEPGQVQSMNQRLDQLENRVIANFNRTYMETVEDPVGP